MIETKSIKKETLAILFERLRSNDWRIVGPSKNGNQVTFKELPTGSTMTQDYIQSTQSAKHVLFPRVEELFSYQIKQKEVSLSEKKVTPTETLLFGIRPCDAAGIIPLAAVFNGDYPDSQFNNRLEHITVMAVSCIKADEYCFCTSVGGGPGDTRGSDILLTPLSTGDYLVEILTEKGKKLVESIADLFGLAPVESKETNLAKVEKRWPVDELEAKLKTLFNHEIWLKQSLRCIGCGACAFVCPTCVCFDIQDEGNSQGGKRLRCWDSCGFAHFTLHTSGHNPRELQVQRWRQRVMHKFSYQPERLNVIGCVGCGRCSRACPVDMNLQEHLSQLWEVQS